MHSVQARAILEVQQALLLRNHIAPAELIAQSLGMHRSSLYDAFELKACKSGTGSVDVWYPRLYLRLSVNSEPCTLVLPPYSLRKTDGLFVSNDLFASIDLVSEAAYQEAERLGEPVVMLNAYDYPILSTIFPKSAIAELALPFHAKEWKRMYDKLRLEPEV